MNNILQFVTEPKALLIAPAGYGKTYTIAACLANTTGHQLVLTHTHAGIGSIREKLRNAAIPKASYSVETISGFVQKLVHAFYAGKDFPDQQNGAAYYSFLNSQLKKLFRSVIVREVIKSSYDGLFVDEYQDCSVQQHELVLQLAELFPVRVFGDPLQGIFDFNGEAVIMEKALADFQRFADLVVPHRWYQCGNAGLGDYLSAFRASLLNEKHIKLENKREMGLYYFPIPEGGVLSAGPDYLKQLSRILNNQKKNPDLESLLFIVPEYTEPADSTNTVNKGDIGHRSKIKARIDFGNQLTLLEAIDDKLFYSVSRQADIFIQPNRIGKKLTRLKGNLLERLFNKSDFDRWFKDEKWINKRTTYEAATSKLFRKKVSDFFSDPQPLCLYDILHFIKKQLQIKLKRPEVFVSLCTALKFAAENHVSVFDAMVDHRNRIRRVGRKVEGKCIGTTLLTKGLEFDSVVIVDAHLFNCPKHLYVAFTRCRKNLFVFSATDTLRPDYRRFDPPGST
jgi:DNA helicase-2/ATP-dependent DNA helicase PcrA